MIVSLRFPNHQVKTFINMTNVPRVGERVYTGKVFWRVVDVWHDLQNDLQYVQVDVQVDENQEP